MYLFELQIISLEALRKNLAAEITSVIWPWFIICHNKVLGRVMGHGSNSLVKHINLLILSNEIPPPLSLYGHVMYVLDVWMDVGLQDNHHWTVHYPAASLSQRAILTHTCMCFLCFPEDNYYFSYPLFLMTLISMANCLYCECVLIYMFVCLSFYLPLLPTSLSLMVAPHFNSNFPWAGALMGLPGLCRRSPSSPLKMPFAHSLSG